MTASYSGGTVQCGVLKACLKNTPLDLLYQCLTKENKLKAGKATAGITFSDNNKITLSMNWEWIEGSKGSGQSLYLEQ
jgi:hypothetical protein